MTCLVRCLSARGRKVKGYILDPCHRLCLLAEPRTGQRRACLLSGLEASICSLAIGLVPLAAVAGIQAFTNEGVLYSTVIVVSTNMHPPSSVLASATPTCHKAGVFNEVRSLAVPLVSTAKVA